MGNRRTSNRTSDAFYLLGNVSYLKKNNRFKHTKRREWQDARTLMKYPIETTTNTKEQYKNALHRDEKFKNNP